MGQQPRKPRYGVVTDKKFSIGLQPANGAYGMMLDFPFERPHYYYVQLDGAIWMQVNKEDYYRLSIGKTEAFDQFSPVEGNEIREFAGMLLIMGLTLIFVVGISVVVWCL